MKQNELDLLHRYLDGAITPEELESLEDLLRSSAEARSTRFSEIKYDMIATCYVRLCLYIMLQSFYQIMCNREFEL